MTDKPQLLRRMKCSICGDKIKPHPVSRWAGGNNAQPVNDGRCCDDCNAMVVIPRRIRDMMQRRK